MSEEMFLRAHAVLSRPAPTRAPGPPVLPRAADLGVQVPLEQRQRFQQLFSPEGMAFGGQRLVGTAATAPAFSYLREIRTSEDGVVDLPRVRRVG